MTLRDQTPPPLTLRDTDVLKALRADRDDCGPGIERAEIEHLAGTRFIEGVMRRLTLNGFVVGEMGGRYQLSHEEPQTAQSRGPQGRPTTVLLALSRQVAASPSAAAQTLEARLFELPPVPHYREEAA
jgi:hypothetical protein